MESFTSELAALVVLGTDWHLMVALALLRATHWAAKDAAFVEVLYGTSALR